MFSTRETAVIVWSLVLLIFIFSRSEIRRSLYDVIKSLGNLLFSLFGVVIIIYICTMLCWLYYFNILDFQIIKDYVIWLMFGLLPLISKVVGNYRNINIFRIIMGIFKLSIIPLFIIGEYTLNIWVELVLVPFLVVVTCCTIICENEPKYKSVEKLLNFVLTLCGAIIIYFSIRSFILNISDIGETIFWKKMFIEVMGVMVHIPLLYLIKIFCFYEQIIIRTNLYKGFRDKILATICIFRNALFSAKRLDIALNKVIYNKRAETLSELRKILSTNLM